jgi:hypothetical protein
VHGVGGTDQEADGALFEVGARVVGARVARRELGLEDEAAQLLEVDVRVRVQPLRPRVALLHRRPPPAHLVPHRAAPRTGRETANGAEPAAAASFPSSTKPQPPSQQPPRPPSSPAPSVGLVQRGGRKKEEEADASQREAGDEASSKSGNATRERASSRRFSPFEGSRDETDGFFGTHAYALLFACFVSIF